MANISRDTFDPNKGYRKVIWQQTGAALDFDFNEAQDLARWERDRLAAQLAGGLHLLGSAGQVTPDGGTSRSVVVEGGFAVHNEELVYIPDVATLKVFNDATTTGVHSSLVYVEYGDVEVTSAEDPDIKDPTFGESTARLKRDVRVKVAIGSTTLPTPAPGYSSFKLAVVTHDFDADGTIIQSDDIAQEPYGLTPGELSGHGPDRTLRLVSNRRAEDVATELDTRVNWGSGKLLSVKNHGTEQFYVNHQGKGWFAADLAVGGNIEVSGKVDGVDLAAFKASYDAHNHDNRYYTEAEADSRFANINGATFTGAVEVARDGDAFQFNNTGGSSRTIFRVLRKGADRAELTQETNDNLILRTRTGPAGAETTRPVLLIRNATGVVDFFNPPTVEGVDFLLTGSAGAGISVSKSGNNLTITNTDRGSSQSIFKNIANAAGTTQFSATTNNDTLRFASGGILSLVFDPTNKRVTYSASLSAGTGISVSGNQISNTGIISAAAGSGISVSGTNPLTITNTDRGSSQSIFKRIGNEGGTQQFAAESNNEMLRFASGGILSLAFDPATKKVTYSASLSAGAGISVSGNQITNTDRGSSQSIFKNIANAAGTTQFSAGANNDALQFGAGGIVGVAFDPTNKRVTYSASLSAGTGISVSGNKITNTGIISAQAGSGISVSGTNPLQITNTDRGSSQSIFKNIANAAGTTQFSATTNNDSLRIASGANIAVSFDAATKRVTIAGTGKWPDADTVDGWHASALRDWNNLLNKPSTFPPSSHRHDDLYYTKAQSDSRYLRTSGGALTSTLYINVTQEASFTDDGALVLGPTNGFNLAISGTAIVARNNGGAAPLYLNPDGGEVFVGEYRVLTEANRSEFATANHNHDNRYYTESEVNSLLAGKSDTNHNHDGRYLRLSGGSVTGNIEFQSGGGIGRGIGGTSKFMVCPHRTGLDPFDSGPTDGLTIESDDGIHFIETDADTVVGWMTLNGAVFRWNGTIYANSFFERSSREYKTDIVAFEDDALALIDSVRIVRFHYKEQKYDHWHIGIVAEDTDRRLTGPTGKEFDVPSAVAVLYAGMQEVSRRNRERDARVDALEKENRELRSEVATLKALVGDLFRKVEALAA